MLDCCTINKTTTFIVFVFKVKIIKLWHHNAIRCFPWTSCEISPECCRFKLHFMGDNASRKDPPTFSRIFFSISVVMICCKFDWVLKICTGASVAGFLSLDLGSLDFISESPIFFKWDFKIMIFLTDFFFFFILTLWMLGNIFWISR